jgi:hypothetical protein
MKRTGTSTFRNHLLLMSILTQFLLLFAGLVANVCSARINFTVLRKERGAAGHMSTKTVVIICYFESLQTDLFNIWWQRR